MQITPLAWPIVLLMTASALGCGAPTALGDVNVVAARFRDLTTMDIAVIGGAASAAP
jgi:hypothetical protein